jgi:hypothetical protein
MNITIESLKKTINKLGYKWYTDRPNMIGIRTTLDVPDSFNDFFCMIYSIPEMPSGLTLKGQQTWLNNWGFIGANGKRLTEDGISGRNTNYALEQYEGVKGKETLKIYPITTNPGVYWLNNPMNKLGTAILKPNQWVDCWRIGTHIKPNHRALVQTGGRVTVYRDNNKDNYYQLDENKTDTGYFGINIHGAGRNKPSTMISKYSAGCQVFSNWSHKEFMMDICDMFKKHTDNKFTYTLIDEKDLL